MPVTLKEPSKLFPHYIRQAQKFPKAKRLKNFQRRITIYLAASFEEYLEIIITQDQKVIFDLVVNSKN